MPGEIATPGRGRGLKVLVTGGCGYVGSFVIRHLLDAGHTPVALDNLAAGHRWAAQEAELVVADLADQAGMEALLAARRFDACIHCAASIWVGAVGPRPGASTTSTMRATRSASGACAPSMASGTSCFSSTAAVYGEPDLELIPETAPLAPINPYGASKMMAERALADTAAAAGTGPRDPALLQRRRCRRRGPDRRGHARQLAPDQGRLRDRARPAPVDADQRHRLPDAGRHLHPRLRPRRRPRPGASPGARASGRGRAARSSPTAATATASRCARCWTRRAG